MDAVAFVAGLALARVSGWNSADLVWSLWLSSLVVGYAMIVWSVTRPLRELLRGLPRPTDGRSLVGEGAVATLFGVGTLFGLAFFTVHFGGFHFVHSVFLNHFFPIQVTNDVSRGWPGLPVYLEVLRRYWIFLPIAFLAERAAFAPPRSEGPSPAVTPEAILRRKAGGDAMMTPYRNVIRMHLLIFFFAFAHFAKLENFAVYAVVYAVYFFPWRLLGREAQAS